MPVTAPVPDAEPASPAEPEPTSAAEPEPASAAFLAFERSIASLTCCSVMSGVSRSYGSTLADPEPDPDPDPDPNPTTNVETACEHGLVSMMTATRNAIVIAIRNSSAVPSLMPFPRGSFGTGASSVSCVSATPQS